MNSAQFIFENFSKAFPIDFFNSPPHRATTHCAFCVLGVWSFVWTSVLSFLFFSSLVPLSGDFLLFIYLFFISYLNGCFTLFILYFLFQQVFFFYLFIYLLFISYFNCCWLVCYKRHSQNAIHKSLFVGSAHKEETMHWCKIWAYNFGFNWTQFVSDIWSIMYEKGMLHRTVCI